MECQHGGGEPNDRFIESGQAGLAGGLQARLVRAVDDRAPAAGRDRQVGDGTGRDEGNCGSGKGRRAHPRGSLTGLNA